MTKSVGTCAPEESLSRAVALMWDRDCGAVPVVSNKEPVGIVTDRDIAVALTTRNLLPSQVSVADIATGRLVVCKEKDNVVKALKKMGKTGVRRLPVVNKKNKLTGMLSLADVIQASARNSKLRKQLLKTLIRLSRPRPIVLSEAG
ncbi:MAG: CBS domain-containing protein [Acidobacteriota bacterium]|nr:CBS domain-containing protein [Acidobacteriota bacterium]